MIQTRQHGYIVITSAIVLFSVGSLIALSLLAFTAGFAKDNRAQERSNQAKALANACGEMGVQKLLTSIVFVGTIDVSIGQGSCAYIVTNPTAATALISTTGTVGTQIRKVQINLNLVPLAVTKWQEVQ